jgi:dimethylargininase
VYVGRGGRTNDEGIRQLRDHAATRGRDVVAVALHRVLHLKSAVTALPDGTVIGYDPLVDDPTTFPAYLSVPEEPGAHVVLLDGSTVLMSTSAPRTQEVFESRGLRVVAVDISEYEKLEGCVTCLSIRLRG